MENGLLVKRNVKIVLFVSLLLSFFYLTLFYYIDSKNTLIRKQTVKRQGNNFTLYFKRPIQKEKFWILKLRAGLIFIESGQNVDVLELVSTDNRIIKTEKINDKLFQKELKKDLIIRSIKLIPKRSSINRINISISRTPVLSLLFIVYQFVFLFLMFSIGLYTVSVLYCHVLKQKTMLNRLSKLLISMSIMLVAVLSVFFIVMFDESVINFSDYSLSGVLIRTVTFNVLFAFSLISLFYLLSQKRQREHLPVYLPLFISGIILLINIPFKTNLSGDCLLWVQKLKGQAVVLSFGESLSLLLNKFFYYCANLAIQVNPKTILVYTGKLMGVLSIFSLFSLINSFKEFSYKRKLLFLILFSTFGLSALFFGFPDFAYYPLPFLIFSYLLALKYIKKDKQVKLLIAAAFLIVIAGFFHGSAFFSLPVIFLLPILKDKKVLHNRGVYFYLGQYLAIFLTVGITFSFYFMLVKWLGFSFAYNTATGGFDGRQFISFLPANLHFPYTVNFIEFGYFYFRGWICLVSGTFIFLIFLMHMKKQIAINRSDLILFLYGISQLLIVLFWGFDLGVRDFDLYIAPMTFIHLFFLKTLLELIRTDSEKTYAWKYILFFALFSPFYFFVIQVV